MNKSTVKLIVKLINILLFIWSFWCERNIFYIGMITEIKNYLMYILIKLMLVLLLVIEYKILAHIIETLKERRTQFFIKFFTALVVVYSLLFILIYPGVWNYDAIGIVHVVRVYGTAIISQGLLTNLFVCAILSVIPYASAIVVVQYMIDLFITSYIASDIFSITNKKWIPVLLFIMELLPLSIIDNMLIMRMSLYGHLMILLIYLVWNECYINKNILSRKTAIYIGILSGVVSTFRVEALFVWIFVISIVFLTKRECTFNKSVLLVCAVISYLIISNASQNLQGSTQQRKTEIALAMNTSLSLMLQYDLRGDVDKWLNDIDTIMDTEIVRQHPTGWSPQAWTKYGAKRDLSEINMIDGVVAYGKLVICNFDIYLKAKYEQLKVVHLWDEVGYDNVNEEVLNSIYGVNIVGDGIQDRELDLYRMPFSDLRSKLLNRLYNLTGNVNLDNIFLGIIPSFFLIFASFLYSLLSKNGVLLFLTALCGCKFVLMMAGMAMSWPIYFGPVVCENWLLFVLTISCFVREHLIKNYE